MLVTVQMAMNFTQRMVPITATYLREKQVPDLATSIELDIPVSVSKLLLSNNMCRVMRKLVFRVFDQV